MDFLRADKKLIEQHILNVEAKNQKIKDHFDAQRQRYNDKFIPIATSLNNKDLNLCIELQADNLNLRQEVVEDMARCRNKYAEQSAYIKKAQADRTEFYLTGYGIKTSVQERITFMERDLRENRLTLDYMEAHMEYLRDLKSSIDNIGYSMKNLVAILAYM